jgi:hypothetical protein
MIEKAGPEPAFFIMPAPAPVAACRHRASPGCAIQQTVDGLRAVLEIQACSSYVRAHPWRSGRN